MKTKDQTIPVFVFCGGKGTRLREETEFKPKPMVLVGGQPILWHILKLYRHWGYRRFILCLGYKGEQIKEYFLQKQYLTTDFTLKTQTNQVEYHQNNVPDDFEITFVDTGEDTLTGDRLFQASRYLHLDDHEFMLTYGDGLTDLNINRVLTFHRRQKTIGTITGVHPTTKYGVVKAHKKTHKVTWFQQYPVMTDYINAGFMVFNRQFLTFLKKYPNEMIEPILAKLAGTNQLSLYNYNGFWACMDTYKDVQLLNDMWSNKPAWKIW